VTENEPDSERIEKGFPMATFHTRSEIEEYVRRDGLVLRGIYLRGTRPDTELVIECAGIGRVRGRAASRSPSGPIWFLVGS
jgi:hypothetical protein